MTVKTITGLIPTMMATGLVSENVRVATKKKKNVKDMVGLGVTNIVGLSLIKPVSSITSSL